MMLSRMCLGLFLLVVVAPSGLGARPVQDPAKPVPPPRAVQIPVDKPAPSSQDTATVGQLPKIELPEYVITGVASIDLPTVQKITLTEQGVDTAAGSGRSARREASGSSARMIEWMEQGAGLLPETRARLSASMGTFLTPRADGWFAQRYENFDYGVSASYYKTNGFAPQTNRSGGTATIDGGYLLSAESPYFNAARLSGLFDYSSETYRLYGSLDSSARRVTDGVRFRAGFSSAIGSPWQYRAGFTYSTAAVKDSSLSARQNLAEFTAAADIPTALVPVTASARISLATRSALSDENTSIIVLGAQSERAWFDAFFAQAGLHLYVAKGMADQKLTRLYPSAAVGYEFPSVHTFMLGYQGDVRFFVLDDFVALNPYVSSTVLVRHMNVPVKLSGVLESEWSQSMVTRLSVRWEQRTDEALFSDSTGRGVWDLEYLGKTRRLEAELEAFANLSSIGYFALSIVGRSTEILETAVGVPYVPEAEVSLLYRYDFPMGISVSPRMSIFGRRNTDPRREEILGGYVIGGLRAEYSPLASLMVFADIDNLFDVRYEVWKGYRGHPFLATVGLSYTW